MTPERQPLDPPRPTTSGAQPTNPPLLRALRADIDELIRVKAADRQGWTSVADVVMLPGFWCVLLWRLANFWHERGVRVLSRLTYCINLVALGADLAPGAVVGPGLVMPHPVGVAAAHDVVLGARCRIMGLVRIGGSGKVGRPGHPVIGDDVWLLDGVRVFGPVTIGDRAVVGASVMVIEDVPSDTRVRLPRADLDVRPRRRAADADR